MEMTQTVPLVMIASDPVQAKLVQSLSRPGGSVTGVSMSGPDLAGKRLELLREFVPGIQSVAFLSFAPSPGAAAFVRESSEAAGKIGMKLVLRSIDRPDQLDGTLFSGLKEEGAQALVVQPFFTGHAEKLSQLGLKSAYPSYPTILPSRRPERLPASAWTQASGCAGRHTSLTGFLGAQSLPTCRSSSPPISNWRSMSRRRKPSASLSRQHCSPAPTR